MVDHSENVNWLWCQRCKSRKVRCSRVKPTCDRCKANGKECVYLQRAKRKKVQTLTSRLSTTDDALNVILERLQRVEDHCTTLTSSKKSTGAPDATDDPGTPLHSTSTYDRAQSNVSSPAHSSVAGGYAAYPWTYLTTPSAVPELDAAFVLKDAIDQVQRFRLQSIAAATITQDVKIPSELCKRWIQNYFTYMPTEMFKSLVNRKLINMIPDLLELPHVHLDPAIIVVYYGILYHGCALDATFEESLGNLQYLRMLYLCCLRSLPLWQREATGTTTDFIAAAFMSRCAAECFDEELSWRMYTYAIDSAQRLNLHNLDAHTHPNINLLSPDETDLDLDRKGLWELIQMDFFFRLLFNKPPSMTSSLNSWKVNLPWLSTNAKLDINAVPIITFLVRSRMTFILSRFFQALEDPNCNEEEMRPKTEELCEEINEAFVEWHLDELVHKTMAGKNKADAWIASDVAMSGYTFIIFMLRKLSVLRNNSPKPVMCDADVPDSPLAVGASRSLLAIVYGLLVQNPSPEVMCLLFGTYRLYVAFACLLNSILRPPDVRGRPEDVALLDRVAQIMVLALRGEKDFLPLVRALQSLSVEVKRKVNQGGGLTYL